MARQTSIQKTLPGMFPNVIPRYGLRQFIDTERVLSVLEKVDASGDAAKAYLLLCNYAVIGKIQDPQETAYLEKAHFFLRSYSSKRNWEFALEAYRNPAFDGIRQYIITDDIDQNGKPISRVTQNLGSIPVPNRYITYYDDIIDYHEKNATTQYAKSGTFSYKIDSNKAPKAEVTLPACDASAVRSFIQKEQRKSLTVPIKDLLQAALEMQKNFSDDYCYKVLSTNNIKEVLDARVADSDFLRIHEVVNMVGMVGSGKSTMIKVLSYYLAKKGYRIVLVVDTVTEVMSLYKYFDFLGLSVSPLIGRNERLKYVEQIIETDALYLNTVNSKYLTAACMIDGFEPIGEEAPLFGKEPCFKLIKDGKRYTCPYYAVCPNTRMQRDAQTSSIVVTTVAGFAATRIGPNRTLFVDHVINQADLVIFDECDRVQKTLDEFFTPSTAFIEFLHDVADECQADMKKESEDRLTNQNDSYYAELLKKASVVLDIVQNAVRAETGLWKSMLSSTFSSMTLIERLIEDGVPQKIADQFTELLDDPEHSDLFDVFELSCHSLNDSAFVKSLNRWLKRNKYQPDSETKNHIKLFLVVAKFDSYIHELEATYSLTTNSDDPNNELYNFLQARFTAQQRILPSAVIGNLFGMRSNGKKGLELYRQYAYGRALMTELPWLRMNEIGAPLGPHVLLLSGSSWAPGCLEYHVNRPVNYLLEAEAQKRDVLSKTEIMDLGIPDRVSGGGQQERQEHLNTVIRKCMDSITAELSRVGKILMIVNSYAEAGFAREMLQSYLDEAGLDVKAACMIRSEDGESITPESIPRGAISKFDLHPAQILVAPAAAIERGYNIVDESGHSTLSSVFFLVRPMAIPDDIGQKSCKLNGIVANKYSHSQIANGLLKASDIRSFAAKQWNIIERSSKMSLKYLPEVQKTDITAGIFVLILQIFGRLARITDLDKPAPRLYFADGAFRSDENNPDSYDCLNELISYINNMMQNPKDAAVARTLYQPFYEAFMKGVTFNEHADISNGIYPDDEYES